MERFHHNSPINNFRRNLYENFLTQFFRLVVVQKILWLTVSAHTNGDTFFQSTILAPVSVDSQDRALLILGTWSVLNFLLDTASEETLRRTLIFNTIITFASRTAASVFNTRRL